MWQHQSEGWSPYALPGHGDRPAGRDRERLTVQDRRDRLRSFGSPRGALVLFHGDVGSGKSTFVRSCAETSDATRTLTVHVRASPQFDLCEDLALYLEVALTTRRLPAPDRSVVDRCRAGDVAPLLQWTGFAARADGRHGLALFVDDLELASDSALEAVLTSAASLESSIPVSPVMIMAAGSHELVERLDDLDAPPRVELHELGPLDEVAIARTLDDAAARHGTTWHGDAAWLVASVTAGRPLLARLLAHETWVRARPRRGDVLRSSDVRPALGAAAAVLDRTFRRELDGLDADELRYLDRLARATSHHDGLLSAREVAPLEDMLSDALADPRSTRRRLARRGVLRVDARGSLAFGGPTIAGLPRPDDHRLAVRDRAAARGLTDIIRPGR